MHYNTKNKIINNKYNIKYIKQANIVLNLACFNIQYKKSDLYDLFYFNNSIFRY
jgi:hypothetical protein